MGRLFRVHISTIVKEGLNVKTFFDSPVSATTSLKPGRILFYTTWNHERGYKFSIIQCCSAAKFLTELLANNVFAHVDREVKKANRDLSHLLSTMETPMSRLEVVQKKYTELFQDMKRT